MGAEFPRDDRPAWQASAACRGEDPAMFFPEKGDNGTAARAKAICADCPVMAECLAFAVARTHNEDVGVWGGMSTSERREIRKQQKATA